MAGPWEKYQNTVETGPWTKYAEPSKKEEGGILPKIKDLWNRGVEASSAESEMMSNPANAEILGTTATGILSLAPAIGSMLIPTPESLKKWPNINVAEELQGRLERARTASELFTSEPKSPIAKKALEPVSEVMGFIPQKAKESKETYNQWAEEAAAKGDIKTATLYKTMADTLEPASEAANLYLLGKGPSAIKSGGKAAVGAIKKAFPAPKKTTATDTGADTGALTLDQVYAAFERNQPLALPPGQGFEIVGDQPRGFELEPSKVIFGPAPTRIIPRPPGEPPTLQIGTTGNPPILPLPPPRNLGEGFNVKDIPPKTILRKGENYTVGDTYPDLEVEYKMQFNMNGKPYKTENGAESAALKKGLPADSFEVVPVEGGFGYRKIGTAKEPPFVDTETSPETLAKVIVPEEGTAKPIEQPVFPLAAPVKQTAAEIKAAKKQSDIARRKSETGNLREDLTITTDPESMDYILSDYVSRLREGTPGGKQGVDAGGEAVYAGSGYPDWVGELVKKYSSKKTAPLLTKTGGAPGIDSKRIIATIKKGMAGEKLTPYQRSVWEDVNRIADQEARGDYSAVLDEFAKVRKGEDYAGARHELTKEGIDTGASAESRADIEAGYRKSLKDAGYTPEEELAAIEELNKFLDEKAKEKPAGENLTPYEEANQVFNQAADEHAVVLQKYKAREIGDAEYLPERAKYVQAQRDFDTAFAAEQERLRAEEVPKETPQKDKLSDSSAANWIDENFPGANERFPLPKKETPKGEFDTADLEGFSERDTFNLVNDEMPQDGKLPEQVTPRNADLFAVSEEEFLPAVKLGDKVYTSQPGDAANHVSVVARNPEINEIFKRVDSPEPINGWVDKDGKFITSEERAAGLPENIPENKIIAKEPVTGGDVVTPESQATVLKNIAKNIITSEKGTFDIGHTVYLLQKMRDHITIDPIPRMARAKVSDTAVGHAAARIATPHIVDNWLAKVFPDKYTDSAHINNFWSLLTKDNVLDGYQTFLQRARDLRTQAIAAIQKGDLKASYEAEKEALKWDKAANEVAAKHNLRQYDADMRAAMQNPEFVAEVDRYKQVINPELDHWYNEVKGHDPNTPLEGRGKYTDARLNLLTKEKAAEVAEYLSDGSKPMPESNYINYKNPMIRHDQFDRRAKFTGDYTDDMRLALSNVVGHRYYQVTKIRMYNDLIDKGVAIPKDVMPDRPTDIQGEHAVSFEFDFPETSLEGKTREVKKPVWIREDIVRELRGVLNTDMATNRIKVLDGLTAVQLMQIADAVTHAKNLLSAMSVAQGAKVGAVGDIARGIPGVGTVDALKRVVSLTNEIMKDAPSMRAEKAFLAQNGMLRPEFPATGIQKITHGQQFLYKVDTAVRISLSRLFDNLVDQGKALDTMENRRKFVNYAGQYNRRLMGPIMRKFADLGISPFIVAGRNFNRMGVRWITGSPGIEAATNLAAAQMRAVNLTKAAITMSVLPMTLNMLTTGSPMGRTGTPMGAWDLGTDEKESGQHRIIDLAQIIGLRRGLRATGLDAVIEGVRSGKSNDQIAGAMMKDITSTATHPWMGPGPGFIFKAATGKQFDLRGKMEAKRYLGEHGRQIVENIRAGLESTNPLLYSLAEPAFEGMGLQSSAGTKMGVVGKTIQDATGIETPGKFVDTLLKSPSGAFGVKDAFPAKGAAETMAGDITAAKLGDRGAMTKEDAERYERINKYTRPILEAMKTGQDIPDKLLDEAAADEKLTEADIKAIDQRIKQGTALRHKMNTLTAEEALEVYAVATPEEKQDIEDLVLKKLDGVNDQERINKLMPRFNKVFGIEAPEARAEGGPVQKNKPYLVGENAPEVFVPKQDGMIIPIKKPAFADTKWWNQTHGLPPEARARVFYAKLKKVSPAEQAAMFDKAETTKGFLSDKFVAKLKQLKDSDIAEESINA